MSHRMLRPSDVALDPIAARRAPTTVLLGVSQPARAALADIGLQSVFELATSPLFPLAYEVADFDRYGVVHTP